MNVVIGIDPHKASHTRWRSTRRKMSSRASRCGPPAARWTSWSLGRTVREAHLGHRVGRWVGLLVGPAARRPGRGRLDVPATLASRIRVLATGRSNKNDPNDARSVAIAAFRAPNLRSVQPADEAEVLRLLAKRNMDLGSRRTRVICRLHALLAELAPGGIAKELYVSDAEQLIAKITPQSPAEQVRCTGPRASRRHPPTRRPDQGVAPPHPRGREGIGHDADRALWRGPDPRGADHRLHRRRRTLCNRDVFAAYNGTAPIERSSGGRVAHRLSQRGNRQLNHALHMAAISQIRSPGQRDASTTSARSTRARPRRRHSAPSSATSPTPSTVSCCSMSKGVRKDMMKRLIACVVGSAS